MTTRIKAPSRRTLLTMIGIAATCGVMGLITNIITGQWLFAGLSLVAICGSAATLAHTRHHTGPPPVDTEQSSS